MLSGAGGPSLALHADGRKSSDDSPHALKNPRPVAAESTLTENVASPFHAEPRHLLGHYPFPAFLGVLGGLRDSLVANIRAAKEVTVHLPFPVSLGALHLLHHPRDAMGISHSSVRT